MTDKDNLKMQYQLAMAEVEQSQLRARYYDNRIQSGAWKHRVGKSFLGGLPEHGGRVRTEEEIFQDEVAVMLRHIHLAEERLDYAKGIRSSIFPEGA